MCVHVAMEHCKFVYNKTSSSTQIVKSVKQQRGNLNIVIVLEDVGYM